MRDEFPSFFAVMELFRSAVITADYLELSFFRPAGKGRSAVCLVMRVDGSAVGFAEFLWGVAGSLAEVVAEGWEHPGSRRRELLL